MAVRNPNLWNSLQTYEFDQPDAAFPFSMRLARENGWQQDFANRVIDEYRRFLYLAATSDMPMTPSDDVDQVWHLHLAYSRDYWGHLCGQVLKRPLHHGPTLGGEAEAEKYLEWYDKTKARYASEFDAEPPADIWPPAHIRFDRSRDFKRIDTSGYWLVPQPAVSYSQMRNAAMIACFVLITTTAYAAAVEDWKPIFEVIAQFSIYEVVLYVIIGASIVQFLYHKLIRTITKDKNPAKREPGGCGGGSCGASGCGGCGGGCGG